MIRWELWTKKGKLVIVEVEGYYVPECKVKLLSPQQYLREMNGGRLIVDKDGAVYKGVDGQVLNLDLAFANLPFARAYSLSTEAQLDSAYHICPTNSNNINLNNNEKQLLRWHYKLRHCGFGLLQWISSTNIFGVS